MPHRFTKDVRVLTFGLQDEIFAVEAESVREILDPIHVTRVPNAPEFVGGLINVRGTVVPLADLRVVFDMDRDRADDDTRIIVLEFETSGEKTLTGIVADKVFDVTEIRGGSVEPVPPMGTRWSPELVRGIGKLDERFVIIPDLKRIFSLDRPAGTDTLLER